MSRPTIIDLPTYWALPPAGQRACEALVAVAGFDYSDCFQIVVGARSVWFWLHDNPPRLVDDEVVYRVERVGVVV